ncbi:hypothetical protein D3C86_1762610 [compost metagenome]
MLDQFLDLEGSIDLLAPIRRSSNLGRLPPDLGLIDAFVEALAFIRLVLRDAAWNFGNVVVEAWPPPVLEFNRLTRAARVADEVRIESQTSAEIRHRAGRLAEESQHIGVQRIAA